jgi:hypothetical protein
VNALGASRLCGMAGLLQDTLALCKEEKKQPVGIVGAAHGHIGSVSVGGGVTRSICVAIWSLRMKESQESNLWMPFLYMGSLTVTQWIQEESSALST